MMDVGGYHFVSFAVVAAAFFVGVEGVCYDTTTYDETYKGNPDYKVALPQGTLTNVEKLERCEKHCGPEHHYLSMVPKIHFYHCQCYAGLGKKKEVAAVSIRTTCPFQGAVSVSCLVRGRIYSAIAVTTYPIYPSSQISTEDRAQLCKTKCGQGPTHFGIIHSLDSLEMTCNCYTFKAPKIKPNTNAISGSLRCNQKGGCALEKDKIYDRSPGPTTTTTFRNFLQKTQTENAKIAMCKKLCGHEYDYFGIVEKSTRVDCVCFKVNRKMKRMANAAAGPIVC